jgi:REP element-mobilizing transposase RayT
LQVNSRRNHPIGSATVPGGDCSSYARPPYSRTEDGAGSVTSDVGAFGKRPSTNCSLSIIIIHIFMDCQKKSFNRFLFLCYIIQMGNPNTFQSFHEEGHLYFITATICGWKILFNNNNYAQIVLNSLDWMHNNERIKLFAFVIMPSHVHAIIFPLQTTIGKLLQQFGSFTAHKILNQLRKDNFAELIDFFQRQTVQRDHHHRIWQDIQAKNIYSSEFLEQKIEYIHNNPLVAGLIGEEARSKYIYSSACFYDEEIDPVIPVDNVFEFW